MKYDCSFSGGKDSTAMLLMLIEKGCPLDRIIFFDTGWEFPQMYDHINMD
jgi:3'-phosphoadenosine 5'-phosphosulfate sulfotransferase (PAPS reductase)/FAD synthetase